MKNISFRNDVLPLKNALYRLALRITLDSADAEDIVQETLIKVWNKRDQWEEIESIEAFCLTICRNLSLDHIKKSGSQHESLDEMNTEKPDRSLNPYEHIIQKDHIQIVRNIINSLPEKQKTCVQLRDFEGKTYKEIAHIMDITEKQVKVNIFRARQAIKQRFQKLNNYGL